MTVDLIHKIQPSSSFNHIDKTYPSKNETHSVNEIGIKRLKQVQSRCEKVWAALGLCVKILFAPITLLVYCIHKLFSKIASSNGLGTKTQTKQIDLEKRSQLLSLGGENISFGFNKKSLLEGMFFQNDSPCTTPKTILICAGSHQSHEYYTIPMVKALKSLGHHVMVFNYEGFGNSEGIASEQGVYRSAEAAYQYLKQEKNLKDEDIVAWGYSLGSGAVTNLALKHKKISIVLDRAISSMSEAAYQVAPNGLKTIARFIFFIGAHFDNVSKLKKIKGNVFLAQGKDDVTMNFLQDSILNNPHAIFKKVNSKHIHGDKVWFGEGKDRGAIKGFLNKKSL